MKSEGKLKLAKPPAAPHPTAAAARPPSPRRHRNKRRSAGYWLAAAAGLAVLLALPGRALVIAAAHFSASHLAGYVAGVSLITIWQLRSDKRAAKSGEWRVPESRLHFLELAGGWPASFAAQRVLRHKTSKSSYQASFWIVVAAHQYAAFDFAQNWVWTKAAYAALEPLLR